ncbi:hypothetical protein P0R28_12645 [Bradyrhizobium yuanmingense]|nr:hypothetical protein [Bradyrhizobium yuanmingense]MDF0580370.1 hypothetical protein [Bradyrhizobium yuanmingense]
MSKSIGILGAGIGGLHLALYLQKQGIMATVLTDRAPEQYAATRLMNTVAHHSVTIAREDELGVNHWDDPQVVYHHHDHYFNFPNGGLLRCISAAEPRGGLSDLPAGIDEGLRGSWRPDRICQHSG